MEYMNPGAAFTNAIDQHLVQQAAMRRQAILDNLAIRRETDNHDEAQAALQEAHAKSLADLEEKERTNTKNDISSMVAGDIPDANLVERAKKYHVPLPVAPPSPQAQAQNVEQQPPGVMSLAGPGPIGAGAPPLRLAPSTYVGGPAERLAAQARQQQMDFAKTITDSIEQKRVMEEAVTNRAVPAGAYKPPTPPAGAATAPVMRQNPRTGAMEQIGTAPANAHWMTEPAPKDTSARDATAAAHNETARNQAHQYAVTELAKITTPLESQLDNLRSAETALNEHSPAGDAHVAPMLLKALVSGQGSGFRMTQSEINQVIGGRSKWQSMEAALNQWVADPQKALKFPPEQRADFQKLIDAMGAKTRASYKRINATRHAIDTANDPREIQRLQTTLQEELAAVDEKPTDSSSSLPTVGGTFQGGKVLKVTPVNPVTK